MSSDEFLIKSRKSLSNLSDISNQDSANEKNEENKSKYKQLKLNNTFFLANSSKLDLACDPLKAVTERNLSIYLTHLKIGTSEAREPSEASYKLYENFVKNNKNI